MLHNLSDNVIITLSGRIKLHCTVLSLLHHNPRNNPFRDQGLPFHELLCRFSIKRAIRSSLLPCCFPLPDFSIGSSVCYTHRVEVTTGIRTLIAKLPVLVDMESMHILTIIRVESSHVHLDHHIPKANLQTQGRCGHSRCESLLQTQLIHK